MPNEGRSASPIRAIILDYGEVLCFSPEPDLMDRMAKSLGIAPEDFLEVYHRSRGPYDQGLETPEQYWTRFAREAKVSVDEDHIEQLRGWDKEMWSRVNTAMTDWVSALGRAGYRTVLLSNMQLDMAEHARKNFAWLDSFEHVVFSYALRLIKPDAAIFQHALELVDAKPEEALFVDDREANVRGARAVGLKAIQFHSVEQLRKELQKLNFALLPELSAG